MSPLGEREMCAEEIKCAKSGVWKGQELFKAVIGQNERKWSLGGGTYIVRILEGHTMYLTLTLRSAERQKSYDQTFILWGPYRGGGSGEERQGLSEEGAAWQEREAQFPLVGFRDHWPWG